MAQYGAAWVNDGDFDIDEKLIRLLAERAYLHAARSSATRDFRVVISVVGDKGFRAEWTGSRDEGPDDD